MFLPLQQNGIVTVMPTVNSTTNEIRLYISNFQRLDMGAIPAATVTVALSGLSGSVPSTATLYRLDDAHLNPVAAWQSMGMETKAKLKKKYAVLTLLSFTGSPDYPTPAQVQTLMAASVPAAESVTVSHSSTPSVTVTVPANAAAVVIINGKAVEL